MQIQLDTQDKKTLEIIKNALRLTLANLQQNLFQKPTMIKMSKNP